MTDRVRAKFTLQERTEYPGLSGIRVKLSAVYSNKEGSEDKSFWDATPQGDITMFITNKEAFAAFDISKQKTFYVDFTPAD